MSLLSAHNRTRALACRMRLPCRHLLRCFSSQSSKESSTQSSFIKQILDQVRSELEKDPEMAKAAEDLSRRSQAFAESAEQLRQKAKAQEEKLRAQMERSRTRTKSFVSDFKAHGGSIKEGVEPESSPLEKSAKAAMETVSAVLEKAKFVGDKAKFATERMSDVGAKYSKYVSNYIPTMPKREESPLDRMEAERTTAAGRAKLFRQQREVNLRLRQEEEALEAAKESSGAATDGNTSTAEGMSENVQQESDEQAPTAAAAAGTSSTPLDHPHSSAVVVSDRQTSTLERFGAAFGDMPFLANLGDNGLVDRLFGETELAQAIREMREADPHFTLRHLVEDVEQLVAPTILEWFLEGNAEKLKHHCGEAAFAAVNASIKSRNDQKLFLDTNILAGPNEVEMKGAKVGESDHPSFVFTFTFQQINCLRDSEGGIVEGDVDDIRQVHYAMAIRRHPKMDSPQVKLDYPWQVQELAILGNNPSW